MNYFYKLFKDKEVVDKGLTHSKRRFLKKIRTVNWKNNVTKAYVRINYKKGLVNEGEYVNKQDLWIAINAFLEK